MVCIPGSEVVALDPAEGSQILILPHEPELDTVLGLQVGAVEEPTLGDYLEAQLGLRLFQENEVHPVRAQGIPDVGQDLPPVLRQSPDGQVKVGGLVARGRGGRDRAEDVNELGAPIP
jgi:hypothetical protein